jgi:voltage-gated potassium channel Kch
MSHRGNFMGGKTVSSYATFGRWSRKYSWWLIITMLVIAALLVVAGVVLIIIGKPEHQELLFKIAKILGGGGTALGMLKAFWKQIREKYDLIRLQQTSGHVIICGLGDKGKLLMTTFTKEDRHTVVIIEAQKDHPGISGCKERNTLVMIGDASDSVVLDEANAARAKYLFAVTGDDNTNIKIAHQGKILAENVHKEDEKVSLRCYVHVASSSLRGVFARHELFARTYDYFDASIFNVFETAARVILEKYPPDIYARQQSLSGDAIPIVVIGFGRMGENIVKQAARIGHYATWPRLDISIADRNIKESAEKFLALYGDGKTPPSFIVPDININFIDRDPECLSSPADVIGTNGRQPVAVYIALDDDSLAVSLALRVRMMLGPNAAPIIVCMRSSLSDLMKGKEAQFTIDQNIHGFNILDAACGYQALMEEITDELARTIHSAYVNAQILFSQDDFTTSTPSDLLQSISRDNPSLQGIDEQQPIASLNQIMKNTELFERLPEKNRDFLNSKIKKMVDKTNDLQRSRPFDQLNVTEQTQILILNASLLDVTCPKFYPAKKRENTALVAWGNLNEVMKDANRWSADHLSVKLRAIGFDGQGISDAGKAATDPEFIERLSEMEHRRWMAERLMDGWRYGPKRDNTKKIHRLLVPYEQLSVEEKNKDKDMIDNIKNLVASSGWKEQLKYVQKLP